MRLRNIESNVFDIRLPPQSMHAERKHFVIVEQLLCWFLQPRHLEKRALDLYRAPRAYLLTLLPVSCLATLVHSRFVIHSISND